MACGEGGEGGEGGGRREGEEEREGWEEKVEVKKGAGVITYTSCLS
jgi:hypothetical protein